MMCGDELYDDDVTSGIIEGGRYRVPVVRPDPFGNEAERAAYEEAEDAYHNDLAGLDPL